MKARGIGAPTDNARLADRAALLTRAHERDMNKDALRKQWSRHAGELDLSARAVVSRARPAADKTGGTRFQQDLFADPEFTATQATQWVVKRLSERQSVFFAYGRPNDSSLGRAILA